MDVIKARKKAAEEAVQFNPPPAIPDLLLSGASSFTPEDSSHNDSDPLTSDVPHRELDSFTNLAIQRSGAVFAPLGASPTPRPAGSNPRITIGRNGEVVFSLEPGSVRGAITGDRLRGGRTLGQAKQVAASIVEEELLHIAWLAGIKEQATPEDQKLHGWMQRTGKQPAAYPKLDVEKKIGRTLTDHEWYDCTAASGKGRFDPLNQALDGTLEIPRTIKGTRDRHSACHPQRLGCRDGAPAASCHQRGGRKWT